MNRDAWADRWSPAAKAEEAQARADLLASGEPGGRGGRRGRAPPPLLRATSRGKLFLLQGGVTLPTCTRLPC